MTGALEWVGTWGGILLPEMTASPNGLVMCQRISDSPAQKNLFLGKGDKKYKLQTVGEGSFP